MKFRNTFVHLSYFTVNLVILAKKAVIKNFSKVTSKNWAYLPIADWSLVYLKKTWAKRNWNLWKILAKFLVSQFWYNSVVILDKKIYLEKMNKIQFLKLSKRINIKIFWWIWREKIREPLKELCQLNIIDKKTYDKLWPVSSFFGILYGLEKVHKQPVNNCPPFRPILSAIGTPTYNIAKFLVPILKPLTTDDNTLKDTLEFSCDILNQNPNLFMESLDVDSLFTNIRLDETTNIIIEKLFSENETI